MDEFLAAVERQKQRAAIRLAYVAAIALCLRGAMLIQEPDVLWVGISEIFLGLSFLSVPYIIHRNPSQFDLWRRVAVVFAFCIQPPIAWVLGPTSSQSFFFDGVTAIGIGYVLSSKGLALWVALKILVELVVYSAEVGLGRSTWAATTPVAQDTLLNLGLAGVITYTLRYLNEQREQQLKEQHLRLTEAKAESERQYEATKAAKTESEALVQELGEINASLREASEVRGRFLANMSHEIRTPMNAVVGMSDLLLDTKLSEEQVELAKVIQSSSRSLLRVLNDILDLSKLQAGRMEVHATPTDLRAMLKATARTFERSASQAGLQLELRVDDRLPAWVSFDGGRVAQIVRNYLSNAVKFTDEGFVRCRATLPREGWLRVEVIDSGVGIPHGQAERLFQAFEQLDSSTTRGVQGTGLGLSISRELATQMGGEVGVESEAGEGSMFWVELPAPACPPGEPAPSLAQAAVVGLHGQRVLVVDDNPVNRRIAVRHLERLGIRSAVAENGLEAIEQLSEAGHFDAVLMDCQMPRLDGYQATQRIRADPKLRDVRIIALTASALDEDVRRSREAGMDDHLAKPYNTSDLKRALVGTPKATSD